VLGDSCTIPFAALCPINLFCWIDQGEDALGVLPVLLGQAPSLHLLHLLEEFPETHALARVHRLRGYYGLVRLRRLVHHRITPCGSRHGLGPTQAEPAISRLPYGSLCSLAWCLRACMGSATPRDPSALASRLREDQHRLRRLGTASASRMWTFRGSMASPHDLLSTLRPCPCGQTRMTRSQMWLAMPSSGGTFHPQHHAGFGRRTPFRPVIRVPSRLRVFAGGLRAKPAPG